MKVELTRIKPVALLLTIVWLATSCAVRPSSPVDAADAVAHKPKTIVRTGVLQAQPGYTGRKLGVEVEDVSIVDDGQVQVIELNLPFATEGIDDIEVESVTGEIIELPREAEIEPGPDPENTGLRIYLPKRKNWEFRIRLIDLPDDQF